MKIRKMKIKNFRCLSETEVELEKPLLLVSDNGKGKTSILEAFRWLLTGELPNDPIRHGSDYAWVSGTFDDETVIERTVNVPDRFRFGDESLKEKDFVEKMKSVPDGMIRAVTPSSSFFFTAPQETLRSFLIEGKTDGSKIEGKKELTAILPDGTSVYRLKSRPSACIINGRSVTGKVMDEFVASAYGNRDAVRILTSSEVLSGMSDPDISGFLVRLLPVTVDFDSMCGMVPMTQEEQDVLRPLFPPMPSPLTISDVGEVHKELYAERTELSREMKKHRTDFSGKVPSRPSSEIQKELGEVQKLLGEAERIGHEWEVFEKRCRERDVLVLRLRAEEERYSKMNNASEPDSLKLTALTEREAILRKSVSHEQSIRASLNSASEPLKKILGNLAGTACPLCDRLVCTTDRSSVRADLEASVAENERLAKESEKREAEFSAELQRILESERTERDAAEKFRAKSELAGQIERMRNSIPPEPEKPPAKGDVKALSAKAEELSQELRNALAYEDFLKTEREYDHAKQKHDLYDQLVRKTDPKNGVLTKAVTSVLLEPFGQTLTGFAGSVGDGYEMKFAPSDDGRSLCLYCRPGKGGTWTSLKSLSTGERNIALLALMNLFSSVSETGIMVFDSLESCDTEHLTALFKKISSKETTDRYGNILMSAVGHEGIEEAARKAGGIRVEKL